MGQINKLNYIDAKLGAATQNGQQTTRVIYDTFLKVTPGVQPNYLEWFTNSANKTIAQTNLSSGKLDSGEAMVVKELYFTTIFTGSVLPADYFDNIGVFNLFIGNQCVIKDFNIATQWGFTYGPLERLSNINLPDGKVAGVRLLTDIVIPPQVDIKATLQYSNLLNANVAAAGSIGLQLQMIGYGVLFNAGMSL